MLVLTRKIGESIVIDGEVVLTVSSVEGKRVKVCIDAPVTRRILRGEIADTRQQERRPIVQPVRSERSQQLAGGDSSTLFAEAK